MKDMKKAKKKYLGRCQRERMVACVVVNVVLRVILSGEMVVGRVEVARQG